MAPEQAYSPATVAVVLSTLAILGYVLYQVRAYRLLVRRHQDLQELRAGQRRVYRDLESLQSCCEALVGRVPHAVRPAPYTSDDERAIALGSELGQRLEGLRSQLRPLASRPYPRLAPGPLLSGRFARELRAVEGELQSGERFRSDLARAETLLEALEVVLACLARKPAAVQRAFADLQALAEALGQEIQVEHERGTQGLAPLVFEAHAVRAGALEWAERLGTAKEATAAEAAIEGEALRPQLLSRLHDLYSRAGSIAGVRDQALRGQERLTAALGTVEARLAGLRPALAHALQPALASLQSSRADLAKRYAEHDTEGYQQLSQQAWTLVANARSLDQQIVGLAEADQCAVLAFEGCELALAAVQQQVAEERAASRAQLDLSEAAVERLARDTAEARDLLGRVGDELAGNPAAITAALREVEHLAAKCRQQQEAAALELAAWRSQRERVEGVLTRLEQSDADDKRLAQGWQQLQGYNKANWQEVDPGWYDAYGVEREAVMAAAAAIRAEMASGQVMQSAGVELQGRTEELEKRWQKLLQEGQRVLGALARVRSLERQVQEGIAALRAELQVAASTEQELPWDAAAADEMRATAHDLLSLYRRLEDDARWPARADFQQLRDGVLARLHEQLAVFRLSYDQLGASERAALKRRLALVWEHWEPLRQRLARATPATDIDYRELGRRWEALLGKARQPSGSLRQVLDLRDRVDQLSRDMAGAERDFQTEREAVREAEVRLAQGRRAAVQLRDAVPRLLARAHPQVVDEEWERSTKAWRKAEAMVRQLAPQRRAHLFLASLDEAAAAYQEARARARSALVRAVRYALLEDPEGMQQACAGLGRRWERLGVTAREAHIRDLLDELEQVGQVGRLADQVANHFAGRKIAAEQSGGTDTT